MKLIRPFSAAMSAFRANLPTFASGSGYIEKYLNVQLENIQQGCSFSLKELKEYEQLNVADRPHRLTEEKALQTVVYNQEMDAQYARNLFLRSYIPGTACFWTFVCTETMLGLTCINSMTDTIVYTGVPTLAFSMVVQYLVRYNSYDDEYTKWRMAKQLQELSPWTKKQDEVKSKQDEVKSKQ